MSKHLILSVLGVALSLAIVMGVPQAQPAQAQPPAPPPGLSEAIEAQEKHTPELLKVPGIAGTGVGRNAQGNAVIRIYLENAGVAATPPSIGNVPVERVVTGRFEARCYQTRCPRPVPLGVSVGHPNITAGTIGARVKDSSDDVYVLSNNHVLANSNNATAGDSALQPGPFDGGTDPADKIGSLHDFMPIKFSGETNTMDAAIARSSTAELGNKTFTGYTPASTTVEGSLELAVKKEGRTTGLTTGQISEVNVMVTVCYEARGPFRCVRSATFDDQLAIGGGSFSAGGDSGSLIVTQSGNNPVGLLFAGSSARTLANRIQPVLARFGVSIDDSTSGGGTTPPTATPIAAPTATPTGGTGGITLSVLGYKVRGNNNADLTWNGATSANVDVHRNNEPPTTTANDGAYTDSIGRGGGTYTYKVCEATTSTCSNQVTITF
jgi:hypothetical protein